MLELTGVLTQCRNMSWFSNCRLLGRVSPAVSLAFFLLTSTLTYGGEFRLSFLDSSLVLDDTCAMMQKVGFPEPTVDEFKTLVKHHNRGGHRVDVRKFPPPKDGYYAFAEISDLTNRMASIFGDTPADATVEQNTFICFDVACLLLRGAGHGAPLLYENFAAKPILAVSPEREVAPAVLASFRTATGSLYPANGYRYLLGRPRSEAETQLGLALIAARRLRSGLSDGNQDLRVIHKELVQQVKADGFSFPTNCELGLVFYVDLKRGFIKADHASV